MQAHHDRVVERVDPLARLTVGMNRAQRRAYVRGPEYAAIRADWEAKILRELGAEPEEKR